ncbi:unnamed protein product [Phytophthora lilii]|uniref:Unnamed protein product n=1 Tax=Phytophthora lilii TaxID=2077276 RepID=A0A9W6WPG8_9STRA|nr:unnamed protein product [Phytophthora lilii]
MASSIPKPRASLTAAQGLSPVMKVPLGSRVVLSRRRNGTVRYVGKLVNESGEWYGVALDEPKGDNDGMRGKERYFYCPANHGVFVRRKEIYCVKEPGSVLKGPPSPITDESSSCSSNVSYTSTDQQGEANVTGSSCIVHPAPLNSDSMTAPLIKTFKGFRKQLDFISLRTVGPGRSREASPATSPASSSPSSPSARSGLKPPSPFRRFASFSQGLPAPSSPGSPTNKAIAASTDDKRRQSAIPLSPKPSPVRRINSFRESSSDHRDNSIRPAEGTSPTSSSRFNSFQQPASDHSSGSDNTPPAKNVADNESPTVPVLSYNEVWATADEAKSTMSSIGATSMTNKDSNTQEMSQDCSAVATSSRMGNLITASTGESGVIKQGMTPYNDKVSFSPDNSSAATLVNCDRGEPTALETLTTEADPAPLERANTFNVPLIDFSALAGTSATSSAVHSPAVSPREPQPDFSSQDNSARCTESESSLAQSIDRTRSFRMVGRSSSFRVPTIVVIDSYRDGSSSSPTSSSSENSPARHRNSFAALSLDSTDVFDDSEDDQGSPVDSIVPSPRDDISEASAVSAPEPRATSAPTQKNLRSRQEQTAVESLSPDKMAETDTGPGGRPLFFRRMNVGRSPMERRSSYSSFSTSSTSPPRSPNSSNAASAALRSSSRVAELEREISAMRSSHENIVAVLRATNKQHAANVLELRAQVAALTEGNLWLERQLTAKGELVRELREMEKQQQRDTVSVSEVEKILEIKDAQIQTLEREMAQLRQRLARLEADKDSQLYQQFQHFEARRDRDEKRINELRKEVLAMVSPCVHCAMSRADSSQLTREMLLCA